MAARASPQFKVLARLGMGGMGDVHLAQMTDGRGERLVALKRIRADRRSDPDLVAAFQREAQISSLLRHPNVVGVEAWGDDENGLFLATEYVDGRSASQLSRRINAHEEGLPLEAGLVILLDIAAGLAHAHSDRPGDGCGAVVHRDVAADNVLIAYSGESKLTDFGIARLSEATAHTATGTIKGKCAYMAPEVLKGGLATPCSDVYAFGILAHKLLTGSMPFRGRTDAEIIQAALFATPPRISSLRPDLPPNLAALVDACVSKTPSERPQSALELHRALSAVVGADAIVYRTTLSRVMERYFPQDGDELRTEISRAMAVKRTVTVSERPHRHATRGRPGLVASVAVAVVIVGTALLGARLIRQGERDMSAAPVPRELARSATAAAAQPAEPAAQPERSLEPEPATEAAAQPEPAPEPVAVAITERRVTTPPPAPAPKPSRKRVRNARTPAPAAAAAGEPAYLQVLVYPWAQVFIDGVLVGDSPPLPPQKVKPGMRSIILVNPGLNVRRTFKVKAEAGKVTPLKVVLTE